MIGRKNWIVDSIVFKDRSKFIVTRFEDICYIQASKDYIVVKTMDRSHTIWNTLSSILNKLPCNQFIQVHKSYVVNGDYVEFVTANRIKIRNIEDIIPIGRTFKAEIMQQIEDCLFK